jgi:DNA-binding NarL/FixJ family response regulator
MGSCITVLIADDHPLLLQGFSQLVDEHPEIKVVYQTDDPEAAVQAYQAWEPDVVVMDISFGEANTPNEDGSTIPDGLIAVREILNINKDANILMLTQHDDGSMISRVYKLGAKGYILKNMADDELINAILEVAKGQTYFADKIAQRIAAYETRTKKEKDENPLNVLSDEENKILVMIANGKTNSEICKKLQLSTKTVSKHTQNIKQKLGVERHADIIRLAIKYKAINI